MVVIEQGGCIQAESMYSGKVIVFGQEFLCSGKVVVAEFTADPIEL